MYYEYIFFLCEWGSEKCVFRPPHPPLFLFSPLNPALSSAILRKHAVAFARQKMIHYICNAQSIKK